ncbi:Glyco_transf_7N domain-containing protein [Meloidogyne graminicola]|uniref:Glyco_transf_7N domain-containing protein n=1 Tax=Meloidogyne graminicola TaxID=189291 RepID=A0A8T0A282_9BILA|nr:Glyco_transf_7N domain-containing protein [Meloidogyne graminicola]
MQKQKQHHFRRLFPLFLFIVILLIFTNFLLFLQIDTNRKSFKHQLCILFPFKNRWEIAQITIPKLSNFLKFQQISTPKFIIINQTDNFPF